MQITFITITNRIQRLLETRGLAPDKSTVIMNAVDDSMFAAGRGRAGPAGPPLRAKVCD